jgi:hypothetical protein
MPLEVRELVVKVLVGPAAVPPSSAAVGPQELAALKRDIVETCLAELRERLARRAER